MFNMVSEYLCMFEGRDDVSPVVLQLPTNHLSLSRALLGIQVSMSESTRASHFLQKNAVKYNASHSSGSSGPSEKLVGKPLLAFPWWSWEGWLSHVLVSLSWMGLTFTILTLMLCKADLLQAWIWKKKNLAIKKMEDVQSFVDLLFCFTEDNFVFTSYLQYTES